MFCMKCGAEVDDQARFCVACGVPLSGGAPATSGDGPDSPVAAGPSSPAEASHEPVDEEASEIEIGPGSNYDVEGDATGPRPPESWGSPFVEEAPQEWPDYPVSGDGVEGGRKKGNTGKIVAVVAVVLVAVVAVGALLFTVGPLGSGEFLATGDSNTSGSFSVDGSDDELDGQDIVDSLDGGLDIDADLSASEVSGTIFDPAAYGGSLADVETFLEENGLELSDSYAYEGGDYLEPYARLYFTGAYAGDAPIAYRADEEFTVTLRVDLGSTELSWDEDGYADDQISSLAELASDAQITGIALSFKSDVEADEFAATAATLVSALNISSVTSVSASDDAIFESALEQFGLSEDSSYVDGDYIGDVLFVDGEDPDLFGGEAYATLSFMGGEDFGNTTWVDISIDSYA